MATTFPASKNNLSNPTATDELSGHAAQHANANDAIEALETVVGVTNSTDSSSLTYKLNALSTSVTTLSNQGTAIEALLGLEGNNDLTVNGIENPTTIDSFLAADYRTVKYSLQISRGSDYYFSNITAIHDSSTVYVSESDIVSNSDTSLCTTAFTFTNGIISLVITPITTAVTARYIRTALK